MSNTLDLITLAEAKDAIGIGDTTDDTLIEGFITAASLRIDDMCGPVVQRTITDEPHDGNGYYPVELGYTAASVTSVKEYNSSGTLTTLTAETASSKPANGYLLDVDERSIWRRSGGGTAMWQFGRKNILVTYTAGRAATTSAVDEKFKLAAKIMVHHLWRAERGGASAEYGQPFGTVPFAVPNAVQDLLQAEIDPVGFA